MRNSACLVAVLMLVAAPLAAHAQGREVFGRSTATLSPAVKVGNLVYASGALPARGDSTIEAQTTSALNNVKTYLEGAGTKIDNAVKCTVFLIDVKDFQGMNSSYSKFWSPENPPPARSTVVVAALVSPGAKLEIECIAAMPK